jgi:hypothetical protein
MQVEPITLLRCVPDSHENWYWACCITRHSRAGGNPDDRLEHCFSRFLLSQAMTVNRVVQQVY